MELSSFVLRVLLLFLPGVVSATLVELLTRQRRETSTRFLMSAYMLGMGSYLLLYVTWEGVTLGAEWLGLRSPPDLSFFEAFTDEEQRIAWGEVVLATIVALPLAMAVSAMINRDYIYEAAGRLKIIPPTREPTFTEEKIPPLRLGRFNTGGLNPESTGDLPDFHPAPMGLPFQTPGREGTDWEPWPEGKVFKGGRNCGPPPPRPDFPPAPMGIPFQTPCPVSPSENEPPPVKT